MENLVMIKNGNAFVMSHIVAEKFNKEHRTIYRKVEELIKSQPEFGAANFGFLIIYLSCYRLLNNVGLSVCCDGLNNQVITEKSFANLFLVPIVCVL